MDTPVTSTAEETSLEPQQTATPSTVPSLDISKLLSEDIQPSGGTSTEPKNLNSTTKKKKKKSKKTGKKKKKKGSSAVNSPRKTNSPRRVKKSKNGTPTGIKKVSSPRRRGKVSSPRRAKNGSPRKKVVSPRRVKKNSPRRANGSLRKSSGSPRKSTGSSRKSSLSPRRLSIQNYSPRSRQSLMLEEQNDRRILKTPTKRQWDSPSSSFASHSPRFVEERPASPASTKYNPNPDSPSSSSKRQSYNSSPFMSTSPRFIEEKSQGPSHFDYEQPSEEHVSGVGAISFKSKAKRFEENRNTNPAVGQYNTENEKIDNRPSSPFKSTSPRFIDPKPQTQDLSTYNKSSFEVKDVRNSSSPFSSTSKRFQDTKSNGTDSDFTPASSFDSKGLPSKVPFGSASDRFKIHSYSSSLSPADYSSQDVNDYVYSPTKK